MTNFKTRMMIAAATLVVAAGSASAQTMRAEIPFTFSADGVTMAAGNYQVRSLGSAAGIPIYQIRSAEGGKTVLLSGSAPHDPKKEWKSNGNPVLTFECGSRCSLSEVWDGSGRPAYRVPRPKAERDEPTRTAVIVMHPDKGE